MRLPHLSGNDLAQALRKFGYSITRQAVRFFDEQIQAGWR